MSDSRKIELQYEMIQETQQQLLRLANQVDEIAGTVDRLIDNNNKCIAKIKELMSRVRILEGKE